MEKQTETELNEMIAELRYLAEHNRIMFLRAGGAIQSEFTTLKRSNDANAPTSTVVGGHKFPTFNAAASAADRAQFAIASAGVDRIHQPSATVRLETLRRECAEIVKTIDPYVLNALRALVGPDDVLIAQRYCAQKGLPIPSASGTR